MVRSTTMSTKLRLVGNLANAAASQDLPSNSIRLGRLEYAAIRLRARKIDQNITPTRDVRPAKIAAEKETRPIM
jgi:hypothetical protein